MTEPPWWHDDESSGESTGSAAEEAARLFLAMRDRLLGDPTTMRAGLRILDAMSSFRVGTGPAALPGDAPECAYCPACQAMARARRLNPEGVERLTGAAMEFAETVRQVLITHPDEGRDDGVRHVPLDEDFGDWPEPVDVPDEPADDDKETPSSGQ